MTNSEKHLGPGTCYVNAPNLSLVVVAAFDHLLKHRLRPRWGLVDEVGDHSPLGELGLELA